MNKHIKNLSLLSIIATGIIVGSNKSINLLSTLNDDLPSANGCFFHWKYGDVFYTKTGEGKPLLLIHDLTVCGTSQEWHKIIYQLSKFNTVYALDLIGCGRSEKPNITYTNQLYAQLLNDFTKKIIGARTNAIATGLSLPILLTACEAEEGIYDKIIGISPRDLTEISKLPSKRKNLLKYMMEAPILGTTMYNMETSREHIRKSKKRNDFSRKNALSETYLRASYKGAKNQNNRGKYLLASIKCNYINGNIVSTIKSLNHSICLIGGQKDREIHRIISEYQSYNTAIEEAYIPNTGRLPHLEAPKQMVKLLKIILCE